MGGHPWFYFVEYQEDISKALEELQEREFKAGRYNPVIRFLEFPIDLNAPSPGCQHDSIGDAIGDADADGTRSILDMEEIGNEPASGVVVALPTERLIELYSTHQPSRDMVEENMSFFYDIERGQGIYIVIYHNNLPSEIFFAGYSYD